MKTKFFKYLIITILGIFTLTNSVFAETVQINVDKNNKATITIQDISRSIYSLQLELTDNNGNKVFTFTPNKNYSYNSMSETTSDGKTNIIILVDEVNDFLAKAGDNLLVGALSSTSKPDFASTAQLILVDSELKSSTQTVNVSVNYITDSGSSENNSTSGGGANLTPTVSTEGNSTEEVIVEENNAEESVTDTTTEVTSTLLDTIKLPQVNQSLDVTFNDISSFSWAKESIEKLAKAGILNGDGKGGFNPAGNSKRADVVIMLIKLLGLENTNVSTANFNDVSAEKYYAKYVNIAKQLGFVSGSNGNFNPEANISRQDVMVMVSNILKQLNISLNNDVETLKQFNDFNNISDYAKESVASLVNLGIISGSNGNINPKNEITRAEMSVVIGKLYDLIENQVTNNSTQNTVEEITLEVSEEIEEITSEVSEDVEEISSEASEEIEK